MRSAPATARSGGTVAPGAQFRRPARRRLLRPDSALAALLCLAPLAVAASPSPSPSLDGLLVAPASSNYVDDDDPAIPLQGEFTIGDYVSWVNARDTAATANTLQRLGFVSGYGHVWMERTSSHLLLEAVVAFAGAAGARQWLSDSETMDKADSTYAHPIAIAGLQSYYAWHSADPSGPEYADLVSFVKGNDLFMVIADSTVEDLGDVAPVQGKRLYDAAPPYTIPPSQWPESKRSLSLPYYLAVFAPNLVLLLALVGGALAAVMIWRRRARGVRIVMSPDGYYWWDGAAWRDAAREVPPGAIRSPDGYYWWDGQAWRPAPRPPG